MLEKHIPPASAAVRIIWRNKAIIILLVVLGMLLIISRPGTNLASAGRVLVGIVREPQAYCTFTEINSNDSRYGVLIADGYPGLLNALNNGELDASVLPVQYLKELRGEDFSVIAVTSYLNLVVVENGRTVLSLNDLDGRNATMPQSLKDSLECQMLSLLLSRADIDVNILFQSDETVRNLAQEGGFDIMILPPDQCAAVLLENDAYRSCFNLSNQWLRLFSVQPPAGCVIIARNTSIQAKGQDLTGFLAGVKASIEFINSKHKKAANLITVSGLGDNSISIWKTIPHYAFAYLDGNGMTDCLEQLKLLPAMTP